MNLPEYTDAIETAVRSFHKGVAIAREQLENEMSRIHSEFCEVQDKPRAVRADEEIPMRRHP